MENCKSRCDAAGPLLFRCFRSKAASHDDANRTTTTMLGEEQAVELLHNPNPDVDVWDTVPNRPSFFLPAPGESNASRVFLRRVSGRYPQEHCVQRNTTGEVAWTLKLTKFTPLGRGGVSHARVSCKQAAADGFRLTGKHHPRTVIVCNAALCSQVRHTNRSRMARGAFIFCAARRLHSSACVCVCDCTHQCSAPGGQAQS